MTPASRTRAKADPLGSSRTRSAGREPIEPEAADRAAVPRWRVEDLADRAGLSVDTIRFYQKRRLLPPPRREGRIGWYSAAHLERLNRIRELQHDGLSLAVIGRVVRGELRDSDAPLAAAVAAATRNDDESEQALGLSELARLTGAPEALLAEAEAQGLLVSRTTGEDGGGYTAADVRAVRAAAELIRQGLPLHELLELARAHHDATELVAERAVEMFDEYVREPLKAGHVPAAEQAERLVASFDAMLPAVTALVEHHFRRVLLRVAQEHLDNVEQRPVDAHATDERQTGAPPRGRAS